jgi:predicted small metal-binding protein
MKQFSCGDVVPGCRRTFIGADDDAILAAVAEHAHGDHGLTNIPVALVEQVRGHIVVA